MAFEYKKGGSLTHDLYFRHLSSLSLFLLGERRHQTFPLLLLLLLVSQGDRWRHPLRGKERRGGPTLLPPPTVPPPFSPEKRRKVPSPPSGEIVVPLFGGGRIPILKLISPPFSRLVCRKTHFQEKRRRRRNDPTNSTHPAPSSFFSSLRYRDSPFTKPPRGVLFGTPEHTHQKEIGEKTSANLANLE